MRRGFASTAPSRTTPTPILLALPSKPSTVGMAEAGRRPRRAPADAAAAEPGALRAQGEAPAAAQWRTAPGGHLTTPRVAPPRPRRHGDPARPRREPVLLTARDAGPAPAPYTPTRSCASLRGPSPASSAGWLSLWHSAGISGRRGGRSRAAGTRINSPGREGWGLESPGDFGEGRA